MARDNVLQFRPGGGGGGHAGGGFTLKLFAVLAYLVLAAAFSLFFLPLETGLDVYTLLGFLYMLFGLYKVQHTPRFRQHRKVWLCFGVVLAILCWRMSLVALILILCFKVLVNREGWKAPFFVRFHLLTALLLNMFILMPLLILSQVLNLAGLLLMLGGLGHVLGPAFAAYAMAYPFLLLGVFGLPALWLSMGAAMGRTPYVPWVSGGVRHWA